MVMPWSNEPTPEAEDRIILPILNVLLFVVIVVLIWCVPSSWWVL